ncbi:MAG: ABC transporter ATP-binding protein, partial [Spirochaetia bacterium]
MSDATSPSGDAKSASTRRKSAPLVIATSLSRSFLTGAETLEVLRGVNLLVHEGETVAITGESGCGKS